jgi:hypothetical protein
MPDGQVIETTRLFQHVILIDAKDDVANGVWIDVGQYQSGKIQVQLTDTGTVQIRGFNGSVNTLPAPAEDGIQIGSNITATGFTDIPNILPRFIKAKVTAAGAALSVYGIFRRA